MAVTNTLTGANVLPLSRKKIKGKKDLNGREKRADGRVNKRGWDGKNIEKRAAKAVIRRTKHD